MLFFTVIALSINSFFNPLSRLSASPNNILPPMHIKYQQIFSIPFVGTQEIEYERIENLKAKIVLAGKINNQGFIYYDRKNVYDYRLDPHLYTMLKKYRCKLTNPKYDKKCDKILIDLKVNIIRFKKRLILTNTKKYKNKFKRYSI